MNRLARHPKGLGDLFLVRCEGFDPYTDPESIGFDASYEVPTFILPDELKFEDRESLNVSPEFTGRIYDYKKIVDWYCRRPEAQYRRYRGPMLAWDNTPRHGKNALVFHGATPELYGQWIEDSLAHARRLLVANAVRTNTIRCTTVTAESATMMSSAYSR